MTIFMEKSVKSARKPRPCSWCNEPIAIGDSYKSYRWRDCTDYGSEALHSECYDAMQEVIGDLDGYFEPGGYERGCACQRGDTSCPHKKEPNP